MNERKFYPKGKWKWYGNAGHYICSHDCRFHLTTEVGNYIISTVGEHYLDGVPRDVGHGRRFETMVFEINDRCNCGCGLPLHNGHELAMLPANDAGTATINHMKLCEQYSRQ